MDVWIDGMGLRDGIGWINWTNGWMDWGLVWFFTSRSTAMVMSGRSVHLTTLFSRASLTKQLTSTSCTYFRLQLTTTLRERSGSVVECLTWDRGSAGSSLTSVTALCPWARHIYPSLVLVQHRKTSPYITERLLMGGKESNQTNSNQSWISGREEYDRRI